MSSTGRRPSDAESKEQKETPESSEQRAARLAREAHEARDEISLAEKKVAWGIQYLYDQYKDESKPDAQNISTLTLEAKDLNTTVDSPFGTCRVGDLFPNKLENGITLHVFGENYIQHPPALYMMQQKIRSFCQAAAREPFKLRDTDAVADLFEDIVKSKLDLAVREIYKNGTQHATPQQVKDFNQRIHALITQYSGETVQALQKLAKEQNCPAKAAHRFKDFSEALLSDSTHHRSDTHDILTFDLAKHRFSYDEAASITAHDRTVGTGCANLSLVFEGRYQATEHDAPAVVVSSLVKHASPVAIDDIKLLNSNNEKTDFLIDTYRNMVDVIRAMVRLRAHGRTPETRDKPMAINWIYQMLTTNALNLDHQADAYDYVTRAARLLNHSNRVIDNVNVTLDVGVMNAGINELAGLSNRLPSFAKKFQGNEERRENRNAYFQLSNAVNALVLSADHPPPIVTAFEELKRLLLPSRPGELPELKKAYSESEILHTQMKALSKDMMNCNETLVELENKRASASKPDDQNTITLQIETIKKTVAELDKDACETLNKMKDYSNTIEEHERQRWAANHGEAKRCIDTLKDYFKSPDIVSRLANPQTNDSMLQDLLTMTALVYKAYANELYYGPDKYTQVYRDPEKAALFNAYLIAFQHLAGMMATVGCKSANDRTLVIRLLVAALNELSQLGDPSQKAAPSIPEAYHHAPLSEHKKLNQFLGDIVMCNSALYSSINDTSGATSKVDDTKFPFLANVTNVNLIGGFGEEFAAHKMKVKEPSAVVEKTKSSTPAALAAIELASKGKLYASSATQTPKSSRESSQQHSDDSPHSPKSPRSGGSH